MSTGRVVIFSGPSGVGKSPVLRQVLENHPDYFFSVSATTRAPRPGETPGVSYHYITPEEFQDLLRQDALMEYNLYAGGDYYGTPAQPVYDVLARGGTAILDVDPKGAAQVLARIPEAVTIFVAPPSMAELRRRLESRGDTPQEKIAARLAQARWEIQQAKQYTYLVLNDSGGLARCIAQVEAILADLPEAQCCRYENNTNLPILKEVF